MLQEDTTIANEDQTVWVVCNGEIYNFKELRADLESRGHVFRSRSDTEVIVHLYEEEGIGLFKRLRGMFAIALWDANQSRSSWRATGSGKSPFIFVVRPYRLLFAIRDQVHSGSLWRFPQLKRPCPSRVSCTGYVPAPWTLFEGNRKTPTRVLFNCRPERAATPTLLDVPRGAEKITPNENGSSASREKLLESVRIRLVSDVPLGAFLSGGIDSSAIVAAMAAHDDRPVKTYSIGFEGNDRFYNELPYARIVAKAFATDHHEIHRSPDVAQLLPTLIWHLDEPLQILR